MKALLGRKIGMTQIFADTGEVIPVTVIEAAPGTVTQIKTVETDGYDAVQVGFEDQKPQRVNKPMTGPPQVAIMTMATAPAFMSTRPHQSMGLVRRRLGRRSTTAMAAKARTP